MMKKLETDLISIAHRITAKNKSDINQLYSETQNCMKLSVLRFIEEHFSEYSLQLEDH
jgi:hypothetical protein